MSAQKAKLSLIIPMYNEGDVAEEVVDELQDQFNRAQINYELVLVDNGSTDHTGEILLKMAEKDSRIKVIRIHRNQGYGWGIINGLRWASGEYLGFMGGDGQIEAGDVVRVYREMIKGQHPLCKARRFKRKDGFLRNIISLIFNKLFVYTFKVNVGDINATPKIMTRSLYNRLNLSSKDWFLDAEVLLKSNSLGVAVAEIPVVFHSRQGGSSNVKMGTVWEFLRNMAAYRLRGSRHEGSDIVWREGDPA